MWEMIGNKSRITTQGPIYAYFPVVRGIRFLESATATIYIFNGKCHANEGKPIHANRVKVQARVKVLITKNYFSLAER